MEKRKLYMTIAVIVLIIGLITGAFITSLHEFLTMEAGTIDFWDVHGIIFLVCIAFFPRLTMLISTVKTGGLLWWVGWLIAPRFLVAVLATVGYWNTNKILVIGAWIIALSGESAEKKVIHTKVYRSGVKIETKSDDIEAEFTVRD